MRKNQNEFKLNYSTIHVTSDVLHLLENPPGNTVRSKNDSVDGACNRVANMGPLK